MVQKGRRARPPSQCLQLGHWPSKRPPNRPPTRQGGHSELSQHKLILERNLKSWIIQVSLLDKKYLKLWHCIILFIFHLLWKFDSTHCGDFNQARLINWFDTRPIMAWTWRRTWWRMLANKANAMFNNLTNSNSFILLLTIFDHEINSFKGRPMKLLLKIRIEILSVSKCLICW